MVDVTKYARDNFVFSDKDADAFAALGQAIYEEKYKKKLEVTNKGKYVAIEIISKDFFVGKDRKTAFQKAKLAHPDKIFHFVRIGGMLRCRRVY